MSEDRRRLSLDAVHAELGARFAPFAGWRMPVQYAGIVEEHRAVRERCGVFDVSHMGRIYVSGTNAAASLRSAVTYDVASLETGEAHYALMCDMDGGILDDLFVYRTAQGRFLVVNNAANADAGREQIERSLAKDAALEDRQSQTVMFALQGPDAERILGSIAGGNPPKRRRCAELEFGGASLFACRTGYTGEDGFELIADSERSEPLLRALLEAGVTPCGLGARDTLRLEAALPLYGNDIDRETNPWQAGLGFAVTLDDGADFAGRDALAAIHEAPVARKLTCLKADGRGIMRAGLPVLHGGESVASMSSGGFSPLLGVSIGMAYLPTDLAARGTELEVDVRGKPLAVRVVPRPFYRRKKAA